MIVISSQLIEAIKCQARSELPNESCGYLAGVQETDQSFTALKCIPMTNADSSPEHFSFIPEEQFKALKSAREEGLKLLAVYHSHPDTPCRMSDEDIRLAHDPSMIYIIYSVPEDNIKGFRVMGSSEVVDYPIKMEGQAS